MSVINGLGGIDHTSAGIVTYDNTFSGLESVIVQDAVDEIATLNRSDTYDLILLSDNWSGRKAPFTYRLEVEGITEESTVYVSLPNDATDDQVLQVSDALLDVSGIGDGYVDLVSRGNKLLEDIPVVVHVCNVIPVPRGRDAYYVSYKPPKGSLLKARTTGDAIDELCSLVTSSGLSTSADRISVNNASLNIGVRNVQEALEYLVIHGGSGGGAGGRGRIEVEIPVDGWRGDTVPYVNVVDVDAGTKFTELSVSPLFDATSAQYAELAAAGIIAGSTEDGTIIFKAFGKKPEITLTVTVGYGVHVNLPSHVLVTIPSDGWVGSSAPYTTNIIVDGVTEETEVTVNTMFNTTVEEYYALSHAEIVTGCTTSGHVVLKAFGEKPTIDLPIDILLYL